MAEFLQSDTFCYLFWACFILFCIVKGVPKSKGYKDGSSAE